MSRGRALAIGLGLGLGLGCSDRAPAGRGAGAGAGSGSAVATAASDARPAIDPAIAALPGTIWYVTEGPPSALHALAAGTSREVGPALFPAPARRPTGEQVAIWSLGTGEPGSEQLALVAADGGVTRLGTPATQVRDPAMGPDGAWFVVAANLDGHSDLYRIDVATPTAQVRITRNAEGNFHPTPIGPRAIAFASSRDGDSEIYRSDIDGTKLQRLTAFHRDDWDPIGSPRGDAIAFLSDREGPARIFVMAADGTGQRRVTDRTDPDWDEAEPAWAPDARSIAYIAMAEGQRRLVVVDVATGAGRELTPDGARDAEPSFSPDGAWLVVARATAADPEPALWAVPVRGAGPALRLTPGPARLPRWVSAPQVF